MTVIEVPQIRTGDGTAQRPGARERIGTALASNQGRGKGTVRVRGPGIVIASGTEIEMRIRRGSVHVRKNRMSRTGIVILPGPERAAGHKRGSAHIHVHILS
jgi:hypothetical protein